jgi:hypothetical protein
MPGARAWAPVVAVLQWAVDVKGYPANNWQKAAPDRYRDAMARHFAAWLDDPKSTDNESGLSHLAHMTCCALFLLWHGDDQPAPTTTDPQITVSVVDAQPTITLHVRQELANAIAGVDPNQRR